MTVSCTETWNRTLRWGTLPLILVAGLAAAAPQPLRYETTAVRVQGADRTARVPVGFVLEVLTEEMDEPRMLTFGPAGDLFAGSKDGAVYRLPPPYTRPQTLVDLSGYPHSVAFRDGEILIARTDGLYRAPYRAGQESVPPGSVTLLAALPGGRGHTSRTVAVGPKGGIYASLGITGNCSDQYLGEGYPFGDRRGGVLILEEPRGAAGKPRWRAFASGLRHPVGFAWHPRSHQLYASNNGPDHWGYELPPEVFCRLDPGSFQGMPWYQWDGTSLRRDGCIARESPRPVSDVTPPVATFPARSAPMGVAFVPDGALTVDLEGDAIVALHGSWGTQPTGGFFGNPATRRPPALVVVRFEGAEARRVEDLVTGFQLPDGDRWARPVGVAVGPDGALYFSSDKGTEGLFRLRRRGGDAVDGAQRRRTLGGRP